MSDWGTHLEIGVPEIDAQHRDLVEAVGDVVVALSSCERAAATRILEVLSHHVLVHFETEERWMRGTRFPHLREHVRQHDQLVARLAALARDHAAGDAPTLTALRLRNALSWLEEHTEDEDRRLARHLAQRESPACTPPPGA